MKDDTEEYVSGKVIVECPRCRTNMEFLTDDISIVEQRDYSGPYQSLFVQCISCKTNLQLK